MLQGRVRAPDPAMQGPNTQVAVRLERAHLQLLGQHERLPVLPVGLLSVGRVAPYGDLPKCADRPGQMSSFSVGERQLARMGGEPGRLLNLAEQQVSF